MAIKKFTEEDINHLRASPYVLDVSRSIVHFSAEYKELFGKCVFTPQDLQRRMQTVKDSISELHGVIASTEQAMEESSILLRRIKDEYRQLETWAQVFRESSPDVKKMIASYMLERVTVSRDYEVNVDLSITEAQFFGGMRMEL